jgi:hypothetical protein
MITSFTSLEKNTLEWKCGSVEGVGVWKYEDNKNEPASEY